MIKHQLPFESFNIPQHSTNLNTLDQASPAVTLHDPPQSHTSQPRIQQHASPATTFCLSPKAISVVGCMSCATPSAQHPPFCSLLVLGPKLLSAEQSYEA